MAERTANRTVEPTADPTSPPAVVLEHVSFSFDDHEVLRDVSLTVPKGSMTIILGASGAGKSVLLKLTLGLYRPDSGTIVVNGHRIDTMAAQQIGDPDLWWRIADANGALRPAELTERNGRRLRITTQLIDAKSDRHLWAQTYERELTDALRLQN